MLEHGITFELIYTCIKTWIQYGRTLKRFMKIPIRTIQRRRSNVRDSLNVCTRLMSGRNRRP